MMSRDKSESGKGITLSGDCCVICGWDKKNFKGQLLVEGAHVRPFRNTPDYDKSDNIIGLCPNHHTEYDVGNITIDPVSKLCIHRNPKDPFYMKAICGSINHIKVGNFDYHKKHIFRA